MSKDNPQFLALPRQSMSGNPEFSPRAFTLLPVPDPRETKQMGRTSLVT